MNAFWECPDLGRTDRQSFRQRLASPNTLRLRPAVHARVLRRPLISAERIAERCACVAVVAQCRVRTWPSGSGLRSGTFVAANEDQLWGPWNLNPGEIHYEERTTMWKADSGASYQPATSPRT
ncbi:hypothetical protein GCM10009740_16200 [Terrabacter terrae]|uniref:Uncharacterized protein n=1 Tax=Terrabacter terrae TaxID=318434 RepID=A0ABP5FKV7_9MICO